MVWQRAIVCLNLWHCRKRGVNRLTRHIALNIVVCHSPRIYRPHSLPDSARRLRLLGPYRCKACKYIPFPDGVDLHVPCSWEHMGFERTDPMSRVLPVAPGWEVDAVHLKRSLTECGRTARLFSAIGLTPLATSDLFRLARSPASARLTVGYSPRPISRRMPSMDMRCTQLFEPRMETFRYVPSPSEYLPGLVRLLTLAVVNLFISPPFPTLFPTVWMGFAGFGGNLQDWESRLKQSTVG